MNRRRTILFILILMIAFSFRLWQLGTQSLWHDEGWSVFSAYNPFAPMGIRGADLNAPWAYYASLGGWLRVVGDSVWAMRYWSLLLGVITVAVAIRVTRDFFGDHAAILAGLLVAINPILWVFSQEIRAYVVMPLAAVLLLGLSERWLRKAAWGVLLFLAVVEFLALYSQNLSVPIVAWLNVTVMIILLLRRAWRRIAIWLAAQIALFILYLPWLLTQRPTGTVLNTPPTLNLDLLWGIWQSMFTGIKAMLNADPLLMGLIAAMGVVGVVAVLFTFGRQRDLRVMLVISQVVLVPIFELGIIWAAHIDFHPRYFIVSVPATLMLIAWGVTGDAKARQAGLRLPFALAASVALLAVAITARMVTLMYSSPIYQHDDFRSIAEHYAKLSENDAIIIPYGWEPSLDYYSHHMDFKAKFIEIPLHSSAETVVKRLTNELQGVNRVEVLTWFQLPADVRGAFPCVLNAIATQTDNTLTTSGLRTDEYVDVSAARITSVEARSLRFGDAQLVGGAEDAAFYWGKSGMCALSKWQMNAPTPDQWRLVLRLYNDLGWLIGQSDQQLLNDAQLPTSYWKPDLISTQFSYISLPAGLPNEAYTATISVYDEAHPQGLDADQGLGREAAISAETIRKQTALEPVGKLSDDQDFMVRDGLYLHHSQLPERLTQGQRMQVSFEWWRTAEAVSRTAEVVLKGADWEARPSKGDCVAALAATETGKMLNWCEITVPPTAHGKAELAILDGSRTVGLTAYELGEIARVFSEPAFVFSTQPTTDATFPQIGTLIGASISDTLSTGTPPDLTLMWQALGTATSGYKVFVHLIDANEQVIAQSDAEPVGGERPTYGWVAGEYILDKHTLTYNQPNFTGEVRLAVGLYDPITGERVKLADGSDRIVLPLVISVK